MGHSDPQTTRRYTHATDRAKRAAVEAVSVLGKEICHQRKNGCQSGSRKWLIEMVGTPRFELGTSRTPSVRATRLRHVPSMDLSMSGKA